MTREEAIKDIQYVKSKTGYADEALEMAIQALEAIEKIKTEIKNYLEDEKYSEDGISDVGIGLELALEIIDKHIRGYTE